MDHYEFIAMPARDRAPFAQAVLDHYSARLATASSVLIKPNFVSAEPYPTTTHPEMLVAVVEWFRERLPDTEVRVGDGPAIDRRLKQGFASHPIVTTCRKLDVPFVNLHEHDWQRCTTPQGATLKLAALPLTVDAVVSLPVLKAHSVCGMTCALKNQFGYLPNRTRLARHVKLGNLHRTIAAINTVALPTLFIVDAVETMINAQERRWGGQQQQLGWLLAGTDPVAIDSYGLSLLQKIDPKLNGKEPTTIKHLAYAMEYGLGTRRAPQRLDTLERYE